MYPNSPIWIDLLLIFFLLILSMDFIISGCVVLRSKAISRNRLLGMWIIQTFSAPYSWNKKNRLVWIVLSRNSLAVYAIISGSLNLLISVLLILEL